MAEVLNGNIPEFMRSLVHVAVINENLRCSLTYTVIPRFLAIGSDEDHFYIPMAPTTAQIVADSFSQSLVFPTLSHYEKSGTVINHANLVQSMTGGFKMFKESRSVTDILADLVAAQSKSSNQRERIAK
jgi:hypothetical protein